MPRHVAALAALAALACPRPAPTQPLDRARLAASIDSYVAGLQKTVHVPGMTVLVAQGSQTIIARGYGIADLDHDVPAGPETVYAIASITKQFTAAAIVKLASEGRFGLDDDISKIVPDLPMVRDPVTVRQLLHHTSGIPELRLPGRNPTRLDYSREEWLAAMRDVYKERAAEFSPGDAWAYRDLNYAILGFAVEKITGRTLWEYLREQFFTPLGMTGTARCDPGVVVKHRAKGYVLNDKEPAGVVVAPFISPTIAFGGSGLCSNALDLLKWQRALVENRLAGVQHARMTQTGTLNDGRGLDYGFGLVVWPLGGERVVFHTGGLPGYNSFLAYVAGSDVTVVVLANSNLDIFRIGTELARVARGLPEPPNRPATLEELARYAGTYASGRTKAVVRESSGQLEARVSGSDSFRFIGLFPVRLMNQGNGDFVVEWEPQSRVTFHVSGDRASAAVLRYGDRTVELARELVAPPSER